MAPGGVGTISGDSTCHLYLSQRYSPPRHSTLSTVTEILRKGPTSWHKGTLKLQRQVTILQEDSNCLKQNKNKQKKANNSLQRSKSSYRDHSLPVTDPQRCSVGFPRLSGDGMVPPRWFLSSKPFQNIDYTCVELVTLTSILL